MDDIVDMPIEECGEGPIVAICETGDEDTIGDTVCRVWKLIIHCATVF